MKPCFKTSNSANMIQWELVTTVCSVTSGQNTTFKRTFCRIRYCEHHVACLWSSQTSFLIIATLWDSEVFIWPADVLHSGLKNDRYPPTLKDARPQTSQHVRWPEGAVLGVKERGGLCAPSEKCAETSVHEWWCSKSFFCLSWTLVTLTPQRLNVYHLRLVLEVF